MKKGMTIITVVLTTVALLLGGFTVTNSIKSNKQFIADGYILDPSKEEAMVEGANMQYYFNQGGKYKEKFGTSILFKNQDGEDTKLSKEHFIHYSDGSLGAFTKGVLLDVSDLDQANYGYYSLTKNTILVKNGNSYELSTKGEALSLDEYVWKISDTDYMLISPTVTLTVGNQTMDFEDYAQISYVDNGIVRISHLMGTYQTISAESALVTESGAELNLVGKSFMLGDGEMLSLDDLALNDDSYIKADDTEKDKLNIPTFNVINGKDGASGTNGENGEAGEDGEEGEEGIEGEAGVEGSEGAQGSEGTMGSDGTDGVEGSDGSAGYDGKEGLAGFDGANAAGASSIASAKLNLKPSITTKMKASEDDDEATASDYKVTSNSVSMSMQLEDTDDAIGTDVGVYVYDKATMKLAKGYTEDMALENGTSLVETGKLQLGVADLDPDKEYVVVVKGSYAVDASNTLEDITFFSKTFKTDSVGVSIAKLEVSEDSIAVVTSVTDPDLSGYTIVFYDTDPANPNIARFNLSEGNRNLGGEFRCYGADNREGKLTNGTSVSASNTGDIKAFSIRSDTQYYAKIERANGSDKTGDTEISLHTLKRLPYSKKDLWPITNMQPKLVGNNLNKTMTVSLDPIIDPNSGIKKFRYELLNDSTNAVVAYKESDTYSDQTFEISSVSTSYKARVIAIFDNNEAELELTTYSSDPVKLESSAGSLVASFEINSAITDTDGDSAHYDEISGVIVIYDPAKELLVNNENRLKLTVTNGYNDHTYDSWGDISKRWDSTKLEYRIPFTIHNLRAESVNLLTLYGPYDTDGDDKISVSESNTFLVSQRVTTVGTYPLAIAMTDYKVEGLAFRKKISIMASTEAGWSSAASANNTRINQYSHYETQLLKEITFRLYHVTEDGYEEEIGYPYPVSNKDFETKPKDSSIAGAYVDRNTTNVSDIIYNGKKCGLKTDAAATNAIILDPTDFALEPVDPLLYNGGYYVIKAVSTLDYANNSNIRFDSANKENCVAFDMEKQHIQASQPNNQISVDEIKNNEADKPDSAVSGLTTVGLKIRPYYGGEDGKKITYSIYEYTQDSVTGYQIDGDGTEAHSPENLYPSKTDGLSHGLELKMKIEESARADGKFDSVKLYFKNSEVVCDSAVNTKNSTDGALGSTTVLERGRRYIISYKIEMDDDKHHDMTCYTKSNVYPNCAYAAGATEESIPLYRSKLITLNKQEPLVERYLASTGSTEATWNYRIDDPDGALEKKDIGGVDHIEFNIKQYSNTSDTSYTGADKDITVKQPWSTDFSTWHNGTTTNNIKFTGLSENTYYTTSISYRLNNAVTEATPIVSKKVYNKKADSIDNIIIKKNGDNPAIMSSAGYMYRVTLQGKDLKKLAAARVTVSGTGSDSSTHSVIYDPVWINNVDLLSGKTDEYIGYADLDTSPLSRLIEEGVTTAKVEVYGYYSTGNTGFESYKAKNAMNSSIYMNGSLATEPAFILKTTSDTFGNRMRRLNKESIPSRLTFTTGSGADVNNSLFIPGIDSKLDGFILTNDNIHSASTVELVQRYPSNPLSVSSATLSDPVGSGALSDSNSKNVECIMDETGLLYDGEYYYAEKLETKKINYDSLSSDVISLDDLLPAVKKYSKEGWLSRGCKSAVVTMEVLGSGAKEGEKIYAKLMYKGQELYIKQEEEDGKKYYSVSTTEKTGYYRSSDAEFKSANGITIEKDAGSDKLITQLRIKGLEKESTYSLVYFGYVSTGDAGNPYKTQELYSKDEGKVGHAYVFDTLSEIKIVPTVEASLYSYYEKHLLTNITIDGFDTKGYRIQYKIDDGSWSEIPKVKGGYPDVNTGVTPNVSIDIGPGKFLYGILHTIYYRAVEEDTDGNMKDANNPDNILGSKSVPFKISPVSPSFKITGDVISGGLRINITPNDSTKIVKEYKVELIGDGTIDPVYKMLDDLSGDLQQVEFKITDAGTDYTVKVTATRDSDNDNVADVEPLVQTYVVSMSKATTSNDPGVSFKEEEGKVYIELADLKKFDEVDSIIFNVKEIIENAGGTIENPMEGNSKTITDVQSKIVGGVVFKDSVSVTGMSSTGKYKVILQYMKGSESLGQNVITIIP